ncbi:hypothetical protein Y032_0190g1275 [Ancylostoma ceylanicum]|uniref:Uncharacterized protein n=1 Tax=Ancylostoma ceylanicum TaxID=53326 RepID=A0A016SQA9_9BILA|nr:hypothetical protein Y032_0190g1275 [Ancylostoma ceylanicum]
MCDAEVCEDFDPKRETRQPLVYQDKKDITRRILRPRISCEPGLEIIWSSNHGHLENETRIKLLREKLQSSGTIKCTERFSSQLTWWQGKVADSVATVLRCHGKNHQCSDSRFHSSRSYPLWTVEHSQIAE